MDCLQSTAPTTFSYQPLLGNDIRLLRYVASDGPRLSFRLDHADHSLNPVYWATSYVWGSQADPQTILLNGAPFHVGQNLYDALQEYCRRVRHMDRETLPPLWTDAICIDQINTTEKELQIPRMGSIYRECDFCFVWLGKPEDADEERETLFIQAALKFVHDWAGANMDKSKEDETFSESVSSLSDRDNQGVWALEHWLDSEAVRRYLPVEWQPDAEKDSDIDSVTSIPLGYGHHRLVLALLRLVLRPFFERVWVVQEVCLPRLNPVALIGSHSIALCDLPKLAEMCDDIEDTFQTETVMIDRLSSILARSYWVSGHGAYRFVRSFLQNRGIDIDRVQNPNVFYALELLGLTLGTRGVLEATVPHDRIYGMLGLLTPKVQAIAPPQLRPDYGSKAEDVFHAYTRFVVEHTGDIRILLWGQLGRLAGVPSWVPDYTSRENTTVVGESSLPTTFAVGRDGKTLHGLAIFLGECVAAFSAEVDSSLRSSADPLPTVMATLHEANQKILVIAADKSRRCICKVISDWLRPAVLIHDEDRQNRMEELALYQGWYSALYTYLTDAESSLLKSRRKETCESCQPRDEAMATDPQSLANRLRTDRMLYSSLFWDDTFVLDNGDTGRFHKYDDKLSLSRIEADQRVAVGDVVCALPGLPGVHLVRPVGGSGDKKYRILGPAQMDSAIWRPGDAEEEAKLRRDIDAAFVTFLEDEDSEDSEEEPEYDVRSITLV